MTTAKKIFMRTYGKKRRQITAWISPQESKGAFDSSSSLDDSLFDDTGYTKFRKKGSVSVAAAVQTRGRKRQLLITSSDSQEDASYTLKSHMNPRQINAISKAKKGSSEQKVVRPTRKKAKENNNHEGIFNAPAAKAARKNAPVSLSSPVKIRQKEQTCPLIMKSDIHLLSSPPCHKSPLQVNTSSNLPNAALSRFVTCRQRPITTKVKFSKANDHVLDSSDDFTSREESHLPHRKKIALQPVLDSSVENSSNNSNANPLQETLNQKPIFCSTPSAVLSTKRPRIADQSLTPSVLSVINFVVSPCQEEKDSQNHPSSAPSTLLSSDDNEPSSCDEPEYKTYSTINDVESCMLIMDSKLKNDAVSASRDFLDTYSENSSSFLSSVEGLPSLTEVLKKKCLAKQCTVKVKRLNSFMLSHLSYQTVNSSDVSAAQKRPTTEQHPFSPRISSAELSYESILAPFQDETGEQSSTTNRSVSEISDDPISLSLSDENVFSEESRSEHTSKSTPNTNGSFDLFTCAKLTAISSEHLSTTDDTADCTFQEKPCDVPMERLEMEKSSISQISLSRQSKNEAIDTERTSTVLIQKCRANKFTLRLKRLTFTHLKELQRKPSINASNSTDEDPTREEESNAQSKSDSNHDENISCEDAEKATSNSNNVVVSDENKCKKRSKLDQQSRGLVAKKMRRRLSTDRTATTRKACVSGLSVSRWKNDSRLRTPGRKKRKSARRAGNGSDLISAHPIEMQDMMKFSTPVKMCQLNLSSLLGVFTPHTQHWNRLKSALAIHRKVLLTPTTSKNPELKDISQTPQLLYDADLSDADKVYTECNQQGPLPWNECISTHQMKQCVKIGEGTFGEVFSTKNSSGETIALKVIPLEGSEKVNGEDQKTFGEILHEMIISKELSSLKEKQQNQTSCFIGLNNLHCVRGCYPPEFLRAWDTFDNKKGSENDRPDFFENDQLFIILEFEFGGVDLENSNGKLSSLLVAKSILHQVTAALAVAEQQLHFEHRDLHWGNILVKTTKQKTESFLLNGAVHSVESKGVFVRIIDYSLSRLEIDGLTVSCDISNDEELFMGQGDYQFDIYRNMKEENGNNWEEYRPHSNVLWLHYLSSKLLSMRYRRPTFKGKKDVLEELISFHDSILQYTSATDVLRTCPIFQ
ncbi:uncharacterized protein haspin [Stigmatopora argus]